MLPEPEHGPPGLPQPPVRVRVPGAGDEDVRTAMSVERHRTVGSHLVEVAPEQLGEVPSEFVSLRRHRTRQHPLTHARIHPQTHRVASFSPELDVRKAVPAASEELPVGIYDRLVDVQLAETLDALEALSVELRELDLSEADDVITRFVAQRLRSVLRDQDLDQQLATADEVLRRLDGIGERSIPTVASPARILTEVHPPRLPGEAGLPRPLVPLSVSDLLVNAPDEPRLGEMLGRELASADRVDVIVAFVKWTGIRVLLDALEVLRNRGVPIRLITTTYLGATERKAIDRLARLGVAIRVSYDTRATRLHAKAWIMHRASGYSTAFIGSSNLSKQALIDGIEWNVRIASEHSPGIVRKMAQSFEAYWEDAEFEPYDPDRDAERFDQALRQEGERAPGDVVVPAGLEVRPWPYQSEILDALAAERLRHERWRNLIVAPTGTGKTVVAALDYRRLRDLDADLGDAPSLLFVAHRMEILKQSLATFRAVLNDHRFGELFVGGEVPTAWRHVFASIQTLSTARMRDRDLSRFDVVIVDEFHHAEARTYQDLLDRIQPRLLLGMTATPERADGVDIARFFDDRVAYEMRLWDALNQRLLSPFQYFGIGEEVNLSRVVWRRGGYATEELSNLLTGDDARVRHIIRQVSEIVTDPSRMRALGFCVSVEHAEFMARHFRSAGIAAEAVSGATPSNVRSEAIQRLRAGELQVIFAVDLFNEGFDVPEIDTILFLRPTESATLFLQQLGRGLRKTPNKACLTVLDFIGRQHQEFRFDLRFRALVGGTRRQVEHELEAGFPTLPSGCAIQLDRVAKEIILDNIRQQFRATTTKGLVRELQRLHAASPRPTLARFLAETGLTLEDFYDRVSIGWAALQRRAGVLEGPEPDNEGRLSGHVASILHYDDPERLRLLQDPDRLLAGIAAESGYEYRLARQVLTTVVGEAEVARDPVGAVRGLMDAPAVRIELQQVGGALEDRARRLTSPLPEAPGAPLHLHASYTRAEIAEALGFRARGWPSGVRYLEEQNLDVFLVTMRKEAAHYTPTTMYENAFLSPTRFHWESPSTISQNSPTGQRYLSGESVVTLFARIERGEPFVALGRLRLLTATGDRPIEIDWELENRVPEAFYLRAMRIAA